MGTGDVDNTYKVVLFVMPSVQIFYVCLSLLLSLEKLLCFLFS